MLPTHTSSVMSWLHSLSLFCQSTMSVYPELVHFCTADKFTICAGSLFFFFKACYRFSSRVEVACPVFYSVALKYPGLIAKNMCIYAMLCHLKLYFPGDRGGKNK